MSASRPGPYIGRPIPRVEDQRLVTGAGRYTDDIALPNQLHAHFVRSPYPHAEIGAVDVLAAASAPGVIAVLTAEDYRADGLRGIAHRPNPAGAADHRERAFDPTAVVDLPHWPLARDRTRYLGEPVAVVIADSKAQARDAADAVEIDYRPRDAVVQIDNALAESAPALWDEALGNLCVDETFGDAAAVSRIFADARHSVRFTFQSSRIVNSQMEPRSVIGTPDDETGELTVIAGSQGVIRLRDGLREILELPEHGIRVVCPDVGGGFGPRSFLYSEIVAIAWAARRLGRPVRWTADRSEAFLADYQGRDMRFDAGLALDESGRFLALEIDMVLNVGAHTVAFVPLANASRIVTTVYDIPAVALHARGVLTNTVPTSPYRGAGRPEATFAIERLIDLAASRFGLDRIDLRRRNLIPKTRLPYRNAMGLTYDSGDFLGNMERAVALSDWGSDDRKHDAAARGKLLGIGLANYVESPVGDPREQVTLSVRGDGTVELVTGTQSTGQGHETTFAQVVADQLGVPFECVRVRGGDTRVVSTGGGTHSDRSMRIAGTLIVETAEKIIVQARAACAQLWDGPPDSLAYDAGLLRDPKSNRSLSLLELAEVLGPDRESELSASTGFVGRIPAHPTGCAVCEVEIDIETGALAITRYTTVDDVGRVVNPLIVDGQVHGGIAQGIGEALFEGVAYDTETGQVLTGSFLDYALPRAGDVPSFAVELREDRTPGNPLAIKGGGEAGITPASAAIVNAVADALRGCGVEHIEMPVTAERIWRAMRGKVP